MMEHRRQTLSELGNRFSRLVEHKRQLQSYFDFQITEQRILLLLLAYEHAIDTGACMHLIADLAHVPHFEKIHRLRFRRATYSQLRELVRQGALYSRSRGKRPVFHLRASVRRALEHALDEIVD